MKQKFLRIGTNIAVYVLIMVMSVISFNCIESPLEPIAPTFDTQLSIPVLDKTQYFGDFTKKDTVFKFNASDGTYYDSTTFSTKSIQIDTMTYQPASSDTLVALGVFDVDAFSLLPKNVSASDLGIPTGILPGGLPAGLFSAIPVSFVDTNNFDYVAVNSGILTMVITNNLPVAVSFPETIVLRNNWNSPSDINEIAGFSVQGILNHGESLSLPSTLDNKFVRGLLTTDSIKVQTIGTSNPISISASDGISLSFRSSPLKVDSALALIPRQLKNPIENGTFTVDDSTVIKEARFKSGSFLITLKNNTKISAQFHVTIHDLYRITEEAFQVDTTIQGGGSYNLPISMRALHISTPGIGDGTHLRYSVGVDVLDSQGEKRAVSKNDFIQAKLQPDQHLSAQSVNGRFKPTPLSINSGFKPEYNLGKDIDKVKAQLFFNNMKLNLRLPMQADGIPLQGYGIPFSYENLELIAKNSKHNQTRSIIISKGIETIIDPTQPNPSIDISKESDIATFTNFFGEFFPDLPDTFFVRGLLTISPKSIFEKNIFYTIDDTSKVYPSFAMSIPTDLSITNGNLAEVEKNPIKDEVDKSVIRSIIDGTMNFEFTNRIPIALKFQMSFLKWDSAGAHSDTTFRISPDTLIKAAEVDLFGVAITPRISNIAVFLTGPQVNTMAQADSVYIKLYFNTGNGQNSVKFRKDDYIRIRSSVNARCTINKP